MTLDLYRDYEPRDAPVDPGFCAWAVKVGWKKKGRVHQCQFLVRRMLNGIGYCTKHAAMAQAATGQ